MHYNLKPHAIQHGILQDTLQSLDDFTTIYKWLHQNPELPGHEIDTAAYIAKKLEDYQFVVHHSLSRHGVVGVLSRGVGGRTVMLRAELDGSRVQEGTGLPYASKRKGVMHARGHDLNMAAVLGAARALCSIGDTWDGTLICFFQTKKRNTLGWRSVIQDGVLVGIPVPDVILGQRPVAEEAGTLGSKRVTSYSWSSSLSIRVFGKEPSTSDKGIDPNETAGRIITVLRGKVNGALRQGEKCDIDIHFEDRVPTDPKALYRSAQFNVEIRGHVKDMQDSAVEIVKWLVKGECYASKTPEEPEVEICSTCHIIDNESTATQMINNLRRMYYGNRALVDLLPDSILAPEDFGTLGNWWGIKKTRSALVFWDYGVISPELWAVRNSRRVPSPGSSDFAPDVAPSLRTGIETLAIAAYDILR